MLLHEYVPRNVCSSISFPIPKGKTKLLSTNSTDYRGISVSPVISKIFEYCLLDKFQFFLKSSDQQFGFKPGISCSQAIYVMTKTVKYYTDRGSNVHICALDLSKAFDKIDPSLLFTKPINRNCPKKLIKILQS